MYDGKQSYKQELEASLENLVHKVKCIKGSDYGAGCTR